MTESPVSQCIRRANAIKRELAESELAELPKYVWSNSNVLHGMSLPDRITIKGIALAPIALMLLLVAALMMPICYLDYLRKLARGKKELREKILGLSRSPMSLEIPPERTLRALWARYGLSDWRHPGIEEDLLCEWVDILYGDGRSTELRIRDRIRGTGRRISEANRPYYQRRPGAAHFFFGKPLNIVLEELSNELPPLAASDSKHESNQRQQA